MRALAVALVLCAHAASAQDASDAPGQRLERRLLLKDGRLFASLGATYYARGDYYDSPGVSAAATYFLSERNGLELRAAAFHSSLNAAGTEVFARIGAVPDAHRPESLLAGGWRRTLGYGKLLVGESAGGVVHFDVQASLLAGTVRTDRAWTPALSLSAGLLARLGPHLFLQFDCAASLAREQRTRSQLALGMLPSLQLGWAP